MVTELSWKNGAVGERSWYAPIEPSRVREHFAAPRTHALALSAPGEKFGHVQRQELGAALIRAGDPSRTLVSYSSS